LPKENKGKNWRIKGIGPYFKFIKAFTNDLAMSAALIIHVLQK